TAPSTESWTVREAAAESHAEPAPTRPGRSGGSGCPSVIRTSTSITPRSHYTVTPRCGPATLGAFWSGYPAIVADSCENTTKRTHAPALRPLPGDSRRGGRRTGFVRVDGLDLRVAIEGEGPPLLLINGIGANIEMWTPFVSALRGH